MKNRAFTLIELLVVIAIIGILATVVMVNVRDAKIRSQNTRAKHDITQGGKAVESWKEQYGGGEGVLLSDPVSGNGVYYAGSTLSYGMRFDTTLGKFVEDWIQSGYWPRFVVNTTAVQSNHVYNVSITTTASRAHAYQYSTSAFWDFGAYGCSAGVPCTKYYCLTTNQLPTSQEPNPQAWAIRNGVGGSLTAAAASNWYRLDDDSSKIVCD